MHAGSRKTKPADSSDAEDEGEDSAVESSFLSADPKNLLADLDKMVADAEALINGDGKGDRDANVDMDSEYDSDASVKPAKILKRARFAAAADSDSESDAPVTPRTKKSPAPKRGARVAAAVPYTHLTLPKILRVNIWVDAATLQINTIQINRRTSRFTLLSSPS